MKRLICIFAAVAALALNAGTGATIDWVTNYVQQAIRNSPAEVANRASESTTNGVTTIEAGVGEYTLTAVFEIPTVSGLEVVTNTPSAADKSITVGTKWADENGIYKAANKPNIVSTNGEWVCSGFTTAGGVLTKFYSDTTNLAFEVKSLYLTDSESRQIKGN